MNNSQLCECWAPRCTYQTQNWNVIKLRVYSHIFQMIFYNFAVLHISLSLRILYSYCHVFQWLRHRLEFVNQFTWSSLVVTTISSYTLKITLNIAHVTSHTKSSNSSSGHTAVPLELWISSEVNFHSRILLYPLGTDHTQKTQFYCCVAQTTQKTSLMITISPVHWHADCCLATSYKHSSYCCVHVSQAVYWAIAWQCVDMSQYTKRISYETLFIPDTVLLILSQSALYYTS
jgi:hypothetical protein